MKVQDLVKLNLDELETELAKGSFSKSFLDSLLKAEKSDKSPRKGALELIQDALETLLINEAHDKMNGGESEFYSNDEASEIMEDKKQKVKAAKGYVVAKGQSIGFRAGIKTGGDTVDIAWPEFKANAKLLKSMLERGLVVKQ